jgi:hypothetical protein
MLSAAAVRNEKDKEDIVFLAYQSPNNDFQIATYSKKDGDDSGKWHETQPVISASPPKELSGIGIGLVMTGDKKSIDDLYLKMTVLSADNYIIQFSSPASSESLDFGKSGGDEPQRIGEAESYSNLAMFNNFMVFQTEDGEIDFRLQVWVSPDQFAQDLPRYDAGARKGTKFALVPLSQDYDDVVHKSGMAVLYDKSGVLSTLTPNDTFANPFQRFPDDISLQRSSSFTAFSVAHSGQDDIVDIHVLYQDGSPDFKQISSQDGGRTWDRFSPDALSGGDIGTNIACTSPVVISDKGSSKIQAASSITRCFFVKDGFMTEAQFDGSEWKSLGEVPLP